MSKEARAASVRAGMRQVGVSAIAPDTVTLDCDIEKMGLALDADTKSLLQFTSEVAFADDFSVSFDVTASLLAFMAICRRVRTGVRSLGITSRLGAAPTAMGAWLHPRSDSTRLCRIRRRGLKSETMAKQVGRFPVSLLATAELHREWFQAIGIDTPRNAHCNRWIATRNLS